MIRQRLSSETRWWEGIVREVAGAGAASRTNHVDAAPDPERAFIVAGAAPRANHVDAADQPGHANAGCQPGRGDVERSAPRPPAGIGHPHPERAAQFKPFAALRVAYYEAGSIVTQTGAVGQLDTVGRTLAVVRKRVPIDDIVSLERCET